MEGMAQTDVLVVGAGPTGLTLACDLARRGLAVRIVDRAPEFHGGSRGKGLSPRSLEVFDDLAVIDRMLASGITHMPHRKYRGAEVIAEIDPEAGRVPTPDIPYPTGLMIPQWRVEQILRERLAGFEVDGLGRDAWHQWFTDDGAIMLCPLPGTAAFQVQASHELDQHGSPLEPT